MLRKYHFSYSEIYLKAAVEKANFLDEVAATIARKIADGDLEDDDGEFRVYERQYDHTAQQLANYMRFAEVHAALANNRLKDYDRGEPEDDDEPEQLPLYQSLS